MGVKLDRISQAVLLVCGAVFVYLRVAEGRGRLPRLLASHGDDLISLPLVLGLALLAHRLFKKDPTYVLPPVHSLVALFFFGLYFEVALPAFRESATADPWDVLGYGLGWMVFQWGINRPVRKPLSGSGPHKR
jgi:hypothetical protein